MTTTAIIDHWVDGDSGVLEGGKRFRLCSAKMPDRGQPHYNQAKRAAQHLAPDGSEVEVRIMGKDCYGRLLIIMQADGRNVNSRQIRRFEQR